MAELKKDKTFSSTLMKGDKALWGVYLWLIIFSLIETFSASSALITRSKGDYSLVLSHIQYLLLGLGGLLLFQHLKLTVIRNWGLVMFLVGFILYLFLPFFGTRHQGAIRDIWGVQPSELVKFGLLTTICVCLTTKKLFSDRKKQFWIIMGLSAAGIIPIACQNLSTAIILALTVFGLLILGGISRKYIINLACVVAAGATIALSGLFALHKLDQSYEERGEKLINLYFLNRAHTWASRVFEDDGKEHYEYDLQGEKSQVVYAHMALANSYKSPFGQLPGNSQIRDHLPEAYSDYVFAIIFEECGVVGAGFVIVLYLFLLFRAYHIAKKCEDDFSKLLMMGLAILITLQALIHIGVCTNAMFVTGQPLPLISRGGWSILITSIAFGTMFAISRHVAAQQKEIAERQ